MFGDSFYLAKEIQWIFCHVTWKTRQEFTLFWFFSAVAVQCQHGNNCSHSTLFWPLETHYVDSIICLAKVKSLPSFVLASQKYLLTSSPFCRNKSTSWEEFRLSSWKCHFLTWLSIFFINLGWNCSPKSVWICEG